ncbi:hypothetical protein PP427_gp168 [Salmonella phage KM16]|uniref:hypothetical protein n=1 Tax=Salmonella phage KM16 TaxID=2797303 RepID=UPI00248F4AAB|nr:hypothetical protein PP427_gp168 [Salmonella phage KM16]
MYLYDAQGIFVCCPYNQSFLPRKFLSAVLVNPKIFAINRLHWYEMMILLLHTKQIEIRRIK